MKDYSEYFREAVASFLTQNPTLQKELASITVSEAENIGTTVEILRSQVINQRFVEHATLLGVDTTNLVLQFIDVPEDEKNQILKNYHQNLASSLGVDWQDYITINPHLSHL
ncbi:DUF6388 family protein [Acinetobacter baumannii]|uniref:Uncharacterized protein n=1 Tax=Acinetobacter baumannii (strain 1295743) TaxID=1310613 RepID=A0A009IGF5_ACIB9|nr:MULTISPECIES: DUF6388 family protein [Acinetobacter]EXB03719.1 hypothetical protein J512_3818 [Acinetobacter baumannii 1295743]MDC4527814.1 DUF6388 family protein [Acinetobacter baumannii]MDV4276226.1 DUF6388 family protein [Acinetobacter baumannii]QUS49860.1 hypothetical protein J5N61_15660 [Acinetobacter junii]RYL15723.1 hypothetical protein EWO92_15220 [Acinetobacter baumannii]